MKAKEEEKVMLQIDAIKAADEAAKRHETLVAIVSEGKLWPTSTGQFKTAFTKMKQELGLEDLEYGEVYMAFSDAMQLNMSEQKKAEAATAIDELKRGRRPHAKSIFETVHAVMFSE
ncbi:Oidioi.mRNA.OKI2018_I69.PAR.g8443.t1.cds [Oikopleura dioica]|uniref:Oidioi.mRNA.OKI2018_I69.PAR.g8443.t1.cds n=1 Tax=Oikopleura dioica TaxID=34765 RepID=A0ABN7RJY5_OIKDI|nr:Oidioi.mRNA.OKI2018_I69.PAR.g8443.t1.cds [Oikopleura dioica]